MVKLDQVITSNQTLQSLPPGLISIFVGASTGFDRAIVRSFAKYENAPKIYLLDSWSHQNEPISSFVEELKTINPAGSYETWHLRIGILSEVDRICDEIGKVEGQVDLLVMSCGFERFPPGKGPFPSYSSTRNIVINSSPGLEFRETDSLLEDRSTYEETQLSDEEARGGIPFDTAVQFYIRHRFITNLLPLLSQSRCPRIISLLVPGNDSPVYFEALESSKGYLDAGSINHATSLLFSEYAKIHPEITFINAFPGILNSNTGDSMITPIPGILWYPAQILKWIPPPFKSFICTRPEEAAERIVFLATSVRYPPAREKRDEGKVAGLAECPPGWRIPIARAMVMTDGKVNGVYRVDEQGEACGESEVLRRYLEQDEGKWLLGHVEEIYRKMLSAKRARNDESGDGGSRT